MNMYSRVVSLLACLFAALSLSAQQSKPLRVFIRAGEKTHGPNQHDHPRFLADWTRLLTERGAQVRGALEFPSASQLENTDVVVFYAADGMKIVGEQRANFEAFLKRGGGFVVIHDAVVSADQHEWAKKVQGGAWRWDLPQEKRTKWFEGEVGLYFVNPEHPIVRGVSNFDWKDEIYHDLDMAPDARILATSFHSVFVIGPQMWTYEKTWEGGRQPYRAFVSLPGHEYDVFNTPHYRAILLRGIAWAGNRANVDEFCNAGELASLKYPKGGPVEPEKALDTFNVHPDFTMNLVASEPLIEKVISMDWAPDGSLWVAETPEYPGGRTINKNDKMVALWGVSEPEKVLPGDKEDRPARDRISRLIDRNGDGRMDEKLVFYDGLELVTSMVFYKDGVIVAQAPDILWLRDTDNDGKADRVERLYTGFGTFDTHAVINNFRWGLDGWIYSAVGYSAGEPRSGDGSKSFGRITAGVIRFKPDGSALEQYASGSCNTWGFDFAPDGEAFYTTATCGEHLLHIVMSEKALARGNVAGVRTSQVLPDHQKIAPAVKHTRPAYVQIDWVGAFTAAAGCAIYNGGAWPDAWNNQSFLSETTMSLVHNEGLRPSGVSYVASKEPGREDTEFIAGTDLWFRPIHSRVGPDGALYIIDFYNQAAIHNDTRGPAHGARNAATRPDRDHHFGRIWRVQHKQARAIQRPDLASRTPAVLTGALKSANGWVRDSAARLLREQAADAPAASLIALVNDSSAGSATRIAALYTLDSLAACPGDLLAAAIIDRDPVVRKNALRIAAERDNADFIPDPAALKALLNDPEPRVRLNALIALATCKITPEAAREVLQAWPALAEKHLQSAAVGVAAQDPMLFLELAFDSSDPAFLADFVGFISRGLGNRQDAAMAARLVALLAGKAAATDGLKQSVLEALSTTLKPEIKPGWTPELQSAFGSLLKSSRPGLPGATLPLIARWDGQGALAGELKPVITQLEASLQDTSLADDQRGQIAVNLLGISRLDSSIIPQVSSLLGGNASSALQKRVVEALGATGDPKAGEALIAAYSKVSPELHEAVFGAIVRRSDWALALIQALADHKIQPPAVGPANLHRLRTHADKAVSARANAVIDALQGPEQKEKDALIARFKEAVEQPGADLANGKKLYTANCAGCHVFKGEGRNLAPDLTGMGAHGAADLLVHILDPNRVVEPNFISTSIETRDDLNYDGVIERENNVEVVIRNATSDYTIRKDNIQSRTSTGRSLMPDGFEALGAEGLRDLLAYVCADESRFRILDLGPAFTANTSKGIYISEEARDESLRFRKYGTIKVGEVPFDIVSPAKSRTGNNVIVLKGGSGLARTFPQKVEVKVGVPATRLHFLGGVGGWAWPFDGDKQKDIPVVRITVHYAGAGTEEIILRNGVEFADYVARIEVPGSEEVPDLLHNGRQVRWFSKPLKGGHVVERITLESYNNVVAPTFVAVTAETGGAAPHAASAAAQKPASTPDFQWGDGLKTLILGGGDSHDFQRWFNLADAATLKATGRASVNYTETTSGLAGILGGIDVLYLSNNKPFGDEATRAAVFKHAESGKGLLLVHPALWYNWKDWPEYNRTLCGGGSRGHDKYGEFEVVVTRKDHPLMKGLPEKFVITDELYWFEPDAAGSPIEVLATAYSKQKQKAFPQVFTVNSGKARIVGITLGHDGQAHSHPAYQQLLKNSLDWVSR